MLHRRLPRVDLRGHAYYLTCCLDRRRPLFKRDRLAELLVGLYAESRGRGEISLHGYVVMPDHYHVLLTLRGETTISGPVRKVHSLFARRCRSTTQIRGRIWQRRFYDHVLRDERDWQARLAYLHSNPVRAGLAEEAGAYRWSSFRVWETGEGEVACDGLG